MENVIHKNGINNLVGRSSLINGAFKTALYESFVVVWTTWFERTMLNLITKSLIFLKLNIRSNLDLWSG